MAADHSGCNWPGQRYTEEYGIERLHRTPTAGYRGRYRTCKDPNVSELGRKFNQRA